MNRIACVVAVLGVLLSVPARADLPPPDVGSCSGKSEGDACGSGTCVRAMCSRMAPSRTQDGSVEARAESYDCLRCDASEDTGCGSVGGVGKAAPWAIAGAFSLLFLLRRRRRAS